MNTEQLGSVLQQRRKVLRIDQRTLAELAGVSSHTVSKIETGSGNPTLKVISRLLEVLGLELVVRPRLRREAE